VILDFLSGLYRIGYYVFDQAQLNLELKAKSIKQKGKRFLK
jgi:hypothetical protein